MSISRNVYLICGCPGDREEFTAPMFADNARHADQEVWSDFESELMFVSDGADTDMYGTHLGEGFNILQYELSDPIPYEDLKTNPKTHRQRWVRRARNFIIRNSRMSDELKKSLQAIIKRASDRQWNYHLFIEEVG